MLVQGLIHAALVINADATQYTVGSAQEKANKVKFIGKRSSLKPLKVQPDPNNKAFTKYSIKYFAVITAAGRIADPIFIIQDDTMPEEDIDVHCVLGLGLGTEITSKGYVVFVKARATCNAAFYKWFNNTVLIQFVKDIKEVYRLSEEQMTWFQLDGEVVQIKVYKSEETQTIFKEHNIFVGKPSASSTEITQPCDKGDLFRGSKTRLSHISDADVSHLTAKLDILKAVFKLHIERYHGKTPKQQISAAHVRMAVYGLLRVQRALQDVITSDIIEKSFAKTGVYDSAKMGCNVDTMFKNCTATITPEYKAHILSVVPTLVKRMAKNGQLTEYDFDNNGIPDNINKAGIPKDELCVSRRRSCVLTNARFIIHEKEKAEAKRVKDEAAAAKKVVASAKRKQTAATKAAANKAARVDSSSEEEDD